MLMARVLVYCYLASQLSAQSQQIGTAWFQLDWKEIPIELRKNIFFCIMRTQKPLVITLGDFGNITLMSFLMVIG